MRRNVCSFISTNGATCGQARFPPGTDPPERRRQPPLQFENEKKQPTPKAPTSAKQLELKNTLVTVFKAGKRVAIQSGPGVGKTSIVKEAAEEAGVDLILDHPAISDPTDYKGLPVMQKDGGAKFAPSALLARLLKVTKPTLVLDFDDYGQAAHSVQAATMQLIHGGELGGVKIPTCVTGVWRPTAPATARRSTPSSSP